MNIENSPFNHQSVGLMPKTISIDGETKEVTQTIYINGVEYVWEAQGTSIPAMSKAGYARGATFLKTDGTGSSTRFINIGTEISCNFISLIGSSGFLLGAVDYTAGKLLQADGTDYESVSPGGDLSGSISAATVAKINGATLGTMTPTAFNVIYADGTQWLSATPNTAGLVDTSSNQSIAGEKTFQNDAVFQMDVNVTEFLTARSLDQQMMYWCDDFMEAAAALASTVYSKAHWDDSDSTSGTAAIIAGANGIMELETGATGSQTAILKYAGSGTFSLAKEWMFEARIKTDALTNRQVLVGMKAPADNNDYIMFEVDSDNADANNIYLVTNNNAAGEVEDDTGVEITAGTYVALRIEVQSDGSFEIFINDADVTGITGTIRDVAMIPFFKITNKAVAQSNKLDIDYVKVWQDR